MPAWGIILPPVIPRSNLLLWRSAVSAVRCDPTLQCSSLRLTLVCAESVAIEMEEFKYFCMLCDVCKCFRQFGPFERTCIEDFFGGGATNRQESNTPHTATPRPPCPRPHPDRKPPLLPFQPASFRSSSREKVDLIFNR